MGVWGEFGGGAGRGKRALRQMRMTKLVGSEDGMNRQDAKIAKAWENVNIFVDAHGALVIPVSGCVEETETLMTERSDSGFGCPDVLTAGWFSSCPI